jgi:hypothetical protein
MADCVYLLRQRKIAFGPHTPKDALDVSSDRKNYCLMNKKYRVTSLLLLTALVGIFAFRAPAEKYFDIAKSLDIFATLFKEVNTYYVDEVDPKKLIETGINGMLEQLDPYTDYISQ